MEKHSNSLKKRIIDYVLLLIYMWHEVSSKVARSLLARNRSGKVTLIPLILDSKIVYLLYIYTSKTIVVCTTVLSRKDHSFRIKQPFQEIFSAGFTSF